MKKYISVNKEGIRKLMTVFSVGERCVKNALAYRSNSELAKKIQFTALEHYYGCTYYIGTEMECFFDSDSCMHQVFPNRAEIYVNKQTGEVTVYSPKGDVAARYADPHMSKIYEMQRFAAAL